MEVQRYFMFALREEIRLYLECYLSGQIPERDWNILLQENLRLETAWKKISRIRRELHENL